MASERIGTNKILLAIPIIILIVCSGILIGKFLQTGEWFDRSIDLKGGTLVSVPTDSQHNIGKIEERMTQSFDKAVVRELTSFAGTGITVQVDSKISGEDVKQELESLGIDTSKASIQTTGPSLGESFWQQAQISMILAFIIMGIIVFIIFRTLIPSTAVIFAAVSDIIATLAFMQIFSIELSLASFAALLMLIGYSIDTDILLTTRIIRNREDKIEKRITGAFKTGMTMTLTTISVLLAVVFTTTSAVLFSIASVLLIGLVIDIINTWLLNATIIRWYAEKKGL